MSDKTCKAPDPNTRTPAYRMPPGACDAHCHVFGPADRFPYAPDRAYTPPDAPYEDLVRLHRILGAERAVIVHASCHGSDMRVTLDGIARSGGSMRGVAVVDPGVTDAELAALDAVGEQRARAVRDYLASLGVAAPRMRTVSYGKERPLVKGENEQAYAQNRRAHFAVGTAEARAER